MNTPKKEFSINGYTFVIFWFFLLAILVFLFRQWHYSNFGGIDSVVVNDAERKVSIRMSKTHQYQAEGMINQIKVFFVIDTGANSVAVPRALAKKAGLMFLTDTVIETASGRVKGSLTRIKSLTLGPIQLANVKAVILPIGSNYVLLGMSALKRLKLDQSNNLLTLTQQVGD